MYTHEFDSFETQNKVVGFEHEVNAAASDGRRLDYCDCNYVLLLTFYCYLLRIRLGVADRAMKRRQTHG